MSNGRGDGRGTARANGRATFQAPVNGHIDVSYNRLGSAALELIHVIADTLSLHATRRVGSVTGDLHLTYANLEFSKEW